MSLNNALTTQNRGIVPGTRVAGYHSCIMMELLNTKVSLLGGKVDMVGMDKEDDRTDTNNCSSVGTAANSSSSSPTLSDSSDEFDMEDDVDEKCDTDTTNQPNDDDENEISIAREQQRVIDTCEVAADCGCVSSQQLPSIQTNTAPTTTATKIAQKRTVQFSSVTIRDYPRTIGDNPASSIGPSISIGWIHESEYTVNIDQYEMNRGPRRSGREMMLPVRMREELLRQAGYSRAEIVRGIRDLNIIRGQRRRTYETLHLQSFQLLTERLSRKAWNVLTFGEYKRKERESLQDFQRAAPLAPTEVPTKGSGEYQ